MTLTQPWNDGAGSPPASGVQRQGRGGPSHRRGRRAGRRIQQRRAGPPQYQWVGPSPDYDRHLITVTPATSPTDRTDDDAEPRPHLGDADRTDSDAARDTAGQPIPVRVSDRAARARPAYLGGPCHGGEMHSSELPDCESDRCLLRPARIGERQTRHAHSPKSTETSVPADGHTSAFIKVELLNIQLLLPKLPDVRADVEQRHPDVLCFTETNLKPSTPDRLVTIDGYRLFRRDRVLGRKKSGGGVAVYVRDNLQVEKITVSSSLSSESHVEAIWLKVKFDPKKAVLLGCFYRPPTSNHNQVQIDFNDVEEQLQHIIANYPSQRIIVAGDLNADEQTNPVAHSRLTELGRYGLSCVVREPTFYRGDCRSVLDVFLLSDALCNDHVKPKCTVESCDYSCHHRRVCLETRIPRCKAKAQYRTARNWRVFNSESFLGDIANVDWSSVMNRRDSCEEQWDAFSAALITILDCHAPFRRFRVRNPKSPSLTDETVDLMSQRRAAKRDSDPSYHTLNKLVRKAIRKDCREALSHRIKNSAPSALFRQLKPVIAPKRGKPVEPQNLTPDELNRYFTTIGIETRDAVAAEFRRSAGSRWTSGCRVFTPALRPSRQSHWSS